MAEFTSLEALLSKVQQDINDTLNKEVADAVKDEIVMAVDDVVYGSGDPLVYQRRGLSPTSQGLGGKSQMHHTVVDGVLEVTDDAEPANDWDMGSLAEAIEYGYGNREMWFNQPRPFIEQAKEELKDSGYHVERMAEGLEKRGYKVTKG